MAPTTNEMKKGTTSPETIQRVEQLRFRGSLRRTKLKNKFRKDFDNEEKIEYSFHKMTKQIKRLSFFFTPRIDRGRLGTMASLILSKSDSTVPTLLFDNTMQGRLRKIIVFCIQSLNVKGTPTEVELMRVVNLLTDVSSNQVVGIQCGASCWLHLIERADFFHELRKFIERNIVLNDNQSVGSVEEITTLCTSILKKPFAVLHSIRSFNGVLSFGGESLDVNTMYNRVFHKFTTSFCTNVIPSLRNSKMTALVAFPAISSGFPWIAWIKYLNFMRRRFRFSFDDLRNVLYSILHLYGGSSDTLRDPDFDMSEFFDCLTVLLVSIDNQYAPIPNILLHDFNNINLKVGNNCTINLQTVAYYEETMIIYKDLQTCLNFLEIPNWMEPFNSYRWEKLYPVLSCIIRLEPQKASKEFHFLTQLAYNRNFIKSLCLEMISDESKQNDEIYTICWFINHLFTEIHDSEVNDCIQLSNPEMLKLINYAKKLFRIQVLDDRMFNDPLTKETNKAIVTMLRVFHGRNTRMKMFPEENFHISYGLAFPLESDMLIDEELRIPVGRPCPRYVLKLLHILREFPFSLSYPDRVKLWNKMISIDKILFHIHRDTIQIRRNFIYDDAFNSLLTCSNLRSELRINWVNIVDRVVPGVDGSDILPEFLMEATRAAIDPNRGLFRSDSQHRIYPNPTAKILIRDFRNHFKFVGKLVGKAVYENLQLKIPFSPVFLELLLNNNKITQPEHFLGLLDPMLYKNMMLLKQHEGDWDEMGVNFTYSVKELGEERLVELKENGRNILVDSTNVNEYIHLVADYKINKEIEEESQSFREGFCRVIPLLPMFSYKELQTLISGPEKPIDLADWAANVIYGGGFSPNHPTIIMFWQVVRSFDENNKQKLLKFVTSCSRPPILGFKSLVPKFGIRNTGPEDRLPTVSTCLNLLKLPLPKNADDLRRKLLYAITAEDGFELW